MVSIVAITRIDVGPNKRRNWIFTHVGLAHNIVQDVEVQEWLLFGIRILCCVF